ncbi:uncharacterized protein [Spinacia oleracea]|uniref:Mariner transposase n=1 Tax=Spinacia oleracea TaxID=3562 RepID=A0A9R0ISI7_SPIOL|nr:uncharacterized protein LOC110794169 [Spinacia oleracea]
MDSGLDLNIAWSPVEEDAQDNFFNFNDAWYPDDEDEINEMEELEEPDFPFDLNEEVGEHNDFPFDLNEEVGEQEQQQLQPEPPQQQTTAHHHPKRPKLSAEKKVQILLWLLDRASTSTYCKINDVAHEFNVTRRTISKIWNTAKRQKAANQRYNLATKMYNCGRKRIVVQPEDITKIDMGDRTCVRDLASMLHISPSSTIQRMIQRGTIKPHTNPLHPGLKEPNMLARVKWILDLLIGNTAETKSEYYPMFDFVHLDEKWFYLSRKSQRVYLAQHEKGKYRAASSSKFIPNVMFTAVVARPRFNEQKECTFDGKIGIFPFTCQEAAKISSKNRDKGTIETKVVESVNQKVTRSMLINQIIPAIKEKWPHHEGRKVIFIQQDNAKAHITQDDPKWQTVYQQGDFTFILIQQPHNSPDLNILDLGFFRSIQSLMHKKMPKDVDKMMEAVNEAFYELDPNTLSNV